MIHLTFIDLPFRFTVQIGPGPPCGAFVRWRHGILSLNVRVFRACIYRRRP